jgi:hypothetical protein
MEQLRCSESSLMMSGRDLSSSAGSFFFLSRRTSSIMHRMQHHQHQCNALNNINALHAMQHHHHRHRTNVGSDVRGGRASQRAMRSLIAQ